MLDRQTDRQTQLTMDSLVGSICVVLLIASLTPEVEPYTDVYIDGTAVETHQPQNPYLWFGPRLGRRKRTLDEGSLPKNPILEESVISVFEDIPWALVPLKNFEERTVVGFSPHMGREEEEIPENSKAPPFAPRLGRRRKLLPFSPRLGREMNTEPIDRFERSISDDSVKTH